MRRVRTAAGVQPMTTPAEFREAVDRGRTDAGEGQSTNPYEGGVLARAWRESWVRTMKDRRAARIEAQAAGAPISSNDRR